MNVDETRIAVTSTGIVHWAFVQTSLTDDDHSGCQLRRKCEQLAFDEAQLSIDARLTLF